DEKRACEIYRCLDPGDLRWIGGVQYLQFRKALHPAEGPLHPLGSETRSAHAKKHRTGDTGVLDLPGGSGQWTDVRQLIVRDAEPAQPSLFVLACPERRV